MKTRYWIVVVLLAIIAGSSRAWAHAEFESSDPKEGERLQRSPKTVSLVFTEAPSEEGQFHITDGCRQNVIESARVVGKSVRADVKAGCAGKWTVHFRVISAVDAHVVGGQFTFRVEKKEKERPKGQDSPGNDPSPDLARDEAAGDEEGSGFPWFLVALGGGMLLGGAAIARYLTKT